MSIETSCAAVCQRSQDTTETCMHAHRKSLIICYHLPPHTTQFGLRMELKKRRRLLAMQCKTTSLYMARHIFQESSRSPSLSLPTMIPTSTHTNLVLSQQRHCRTL